MERPGRELVSCGPSKDWSFPGEEKGTGRRDQQRGKAQGHVSLLEAGPGPAGGERGGWSQTGEGRAQEPGLDFSGWCSEGSPWANVLAQRGCDLDSAVER